MPPSSAAGRNKIYTLSSSRLGDFNETHPSPYSPSPSSPPSLSSQRTGVSMLALLPEGTSLEALLAVLLPLALLALAVCLPFLPPSPSLGAHNVSVLVQLWLLCFLVTTYLFPFAMVVAGRRPCDLAGWMAGIGLPAVAFACVGSVMMVGVQAAGKFERPWSAIAICALAVAYFLVPTPMVAAMTVRMVRQGRTETGEGEEEEEFDARAFRKAFFLMVAGIVGFFLIAFLFLTLFHAARDAAGLQLIALLVYQLVAHVIMKKTFSLFALRSLSERQRLRAYPAAVSVFEAIAELFLAFSFPSVRNYGLLVFAVLMETLMFLASIRRMHDGYMVVENKIMGLFVRSKNNTPVAPLPPVVRSMSVHDASSAEEQQQHGGETVAETVGSAFADNFVGRVAPPPVDAVGDADEEEAWKLGGMALVHERRVSSFGALFLLECAAAMAFALFFGLMCFTDNSRFYNFGSRPDGKCTAGEYALPVIVSTGTALIHLVAFVIARRYLMRVWALDPWALSISWVREFYVLVGSILPTTLAQIIVLIEAHYDMSGFARYVIG